LLSADFGEQINAFVWDYLPLRTQFIQADHWIDYYVFKDSPIPEKVLLGREGWLFLYDAVMVWPQLNQENAYMLVQLAQRATKLQDNSDLDIVIMVSPSKASIYPEYLHEFHQDVFIQHNSAFQEHLETAARLDAKSLLLLWRPYLKEKAHLLQDPQVCKTIEESTCFLFRPRDRHFSWETAIFQAEQIVERLAPGKWQNDLFQNYFTQLEYDQSEMERRFIKVNLPEPYLDFQINNFFEAYSVVKDKSRTNDSGKLIRMEIFRTDLDDQIKTNPIQKRVVIIHDSFMNKTGYFITPYFQDITFIHWGAIEGDMLLFKEIIKNADVLVIETVEDKWFMRLNTLEKILTELEQTVE